MKETQEMIILEKYDHKNKTTIPFLVAGRGHVNEYPFAYQVARRMTNYKIATRTRSQWQVKPGQGWEEVIKDGKIEIVKSQQDTKKQPKK